MKVYRALDEIPQFRNAAVTLGTFDGVHLGHRKIIDRLLAKAREIDGESVLLTFWPHPRMVLYPDDTSLKLLNTIDERIELLSETGIDHLIIVPFTYEFSRMPYLSFVRDILVDALNTKALVVGYDHHFGRNREGSYEQLQECAVLFNFELEQVSALIVDNVAVSSSKIRNALTEHNLQLANNFLGYTFSAEGTVVKGWQKGRELGFPTANVEIAEAYKMLPGTGIYIARAEVDGKTYDGMASLGYNPTFENKGKTLEINLFRFDKDIYGQKIKVFFLDYLREEAKFAQLSDLVQQIQSDKQNALIYFDNLKKQTF
jgi:riboflavin kinase/FMN adenylyltransferase